MGLNNKVLKNTSQCQNMGYLDDQLSSLPECLYTAEQTRELDRLSISQGYASGFALMQSAGREAFRLLHKIWPDCEHLTILCGGGNNGGDGYVVARLAKQQNISVQVFALIDPEQLKNEAAEAYSWAKEVDIAITFDPTGETLPQYLQGDKKSKHVIVDAMLGTGLNGNVRPAFEVAIKSANASGLPVLAIDIPSGLDSDTGNMLGHCVKASATISFIGLKQGLLTGQAPDYVGALHFAGLGVPPEIYEQVTCDVLRADWQQMIKRIPVRSRTAHKGHYGRVLIVGGDKGMAGAALMSAEAACRVGAGLVYLATHPEHVGASVARCPEVMAMGVSSPDELKAMMSKVDVVVVGPGLGQTEWSNMLFDTFVDVDRSSAFHSRPFKRAILDADALNLLAQHSEVTPASHWVMTPHPGEAARLLKRTVVELEENRFDAIRQLQSMFGGQFVLKGAGTLIAGEDNQVWLANTGNPGMAAGGMGDVLSGIIGGLAGQPINQADLLPIAVSLHGEAANLAVEALGEMSLCATDVIAAIPQLLNKTKPPKI
jgi:NAD(P)H-hydrate epimerase